MTPDEREIQEKKIRLMEAAMLLGAAWAICILVLLGAIYLKL